MNQEKEIRWVGSAYDDVLAFPDEPRREAGFQLGKVQAGVEPDDWKPFEDVGAGTREIRIRESSGIYRIIYMSRSSRKRCMSCTASRRKLRRPATMTRKLPSRATVL